uniref:Uncharacterized protein n=1 Tax=Glossina brevipalpis TaxID=37001 RepID=A0A1A9WCU5_9MUSC
MYRCTVNFFGEKFSPDIKASMLDSIIKLIELLAGHFYLLDDNDDNDDDDNDDDDFDDQDDANTVLPTHKHLATHVRIHIHIRMQLHMLSNILEEYFGDILTAGAGICFVYFCIVVNNNDFTSKYLSFSMLCYGLAMLCYELGTLEGSCMYMRLPLKLFTK